MAQHNPSWNPNGRSPRLSQRRRPAFLSFVAGKLREDKTLTTDTLLDQCFEHFNLDALGAAQEDFRPHIVAIHDEVTHSLAKQVKFAFGPEPAAIRTTAAPAPLLPRKQRQQRQDLDNST